LHEELEESKKSKNQRTLGRIERNKAISKNDRSKKLSKKNSQAIHPANEAHEDSNFEKIVMKWLLMLGVWADKLVPQS